MRIDYEISVVAPYINWDYFYYAWGVHHRQDADKHALRQEAEQQLKQLDRHYHCYALFEIGKAYSEGDDVVVSISEGPVSVCKRIAFLRQQSPDSDYLCMADFICPAYGQENTDKQATSQMGIFCTTVDHGLESDFDNDPYQKMMVQLLADRLAEATAERMHEEVRKRYWGYAPAEQLTMAELHAEKFQGIRPAVGYPSLPDTSMNFVIDELLMMKQIGIRLTESGAMKPHASVSGFMIAHPQARYFAVGKIGRDQLADYARRRGLSQQMMRRFLCANL